MKSLLLIVFALLLFQSGQSQIGRLSSPADLSAHQLLLQNQQRKVDTLLTSNVVGSPYISDDFKSARVLLRNRKLVDSVLLKFNALFNEIHFIANGELLALNDAVQISYYDNPVDTNTLMIFRSGYPKYNYQDQGTFYQVVAGSDSIQLLKLIKKDIQTFQIIGTGIIQKRQFHTQISWFVYSVKDGIHPVRSSKKSFMKALPSEAQKIETICNKKDLKINSEDDMVTLIELLSQN